LGDRIPAIYRPHYNRRGILASETLSVREETTEAILNIEYDAKGQRTRIQYGNGTTTRYHYNPQTFRLVQLRTTQTSPGERLPVPPSNLSNWNVLQNLYYTYDPVGNITEIHDDAYEPVFFNNQMVEPRNRYTYDALYRLIEATGRENYQATEACDRREEAPFTIQFPVGDRALRNYTQSYTYDAVGNIQQMRHVAERGSWTRNYAYAETSNRLLRTWKGDDTVNAVEYRYDTHGSMLNLDRTPDEYRLRWDYRDMIHRVNLGGGGQAFYNYDAGKQRTRKRIEHQGNTVEERLYLGGMELYRRWLGNNLVEEIETHHLFVDEQRVLIVEDVLETNNSNLSTGVLFRYQYSNHLGSVGLELDGNAAVISYEEYHPYGTTAYRMRDGAVRATAKRYRYTGMERDEETGLSYHTARYYLPWLGRWGSVDPLALETTQADANFQVNIYLYATNNPLVRIDITGLDDYVFYQNPYAEENGGWEYLVTPTDQPDRFLYRDDSFTEHELDFRNFDRTSEGRTTMEDSYQQRLTSSDSHDVERASIELLTRIIFAESGTHATEVGRLAVGEVVRNRRDSNPRYTTYADVIFDSGQFDPVNRLGTASGGADESFYNPLNRISRTTLTAEASRSRFLASIIAALRVHGVGGNPTDVASGSTIFHAPGHPLRAMRSSDSSTASTDRDFHTVRTEAGGRTIIATYPNQRRGRGLEHIYTRQLTSRETGGNIFYTTSMRTSVSR
jgi:RHS repeat-associated protein